MPTDRPTRDVAPRAWSRRLRRAAAAFVAAVALAPIAACGGDGGTDAETVQQIVIEPEAPAVALGKTTQLSASVRDASGTALAGRTIVWASADASIASVDAAGVVTPAKVGRVQIAASSEGQSDIVELRVDPKAVGAVTVVASAARVEVGDTVSVQITAKAEDGETLGDRQVALSTGSGAIAAVAPGLRVVAVAPGTTPIVADVDGVRGQVSLEVVRAAAAALNLTTNALELSVNESATIGVTVRDKRGFVLPGRDAAFASSASSVATVDGGGRVRGLSAGTATVTVRVEGVETSVPVRVVALPTTPPPTSPPPTSPPPTNPPPSEPPPASVARVTLSSGDFGLRVGESRPLTATTFDAAGNVLADRTVTWSVQSGSVASVSPTGLVAALGTGTTRVEARSEGVTANLSLTVTPVPVARVTVVPNAVDLVVGERTVLTATPADAAGNPLGGRAVTWNTSAPSVATVTDGEVRAVAAGTATVTAVSEGIAGTVTVRVTAAPTPTLPGSPATLEIVAGNEQQGLQNGTLPQPLVVRVLDAAGRPVPGVFVSWTALDGGTASPNLTKTDENGHASTSWTLGDKNGGQRTTAVTAGVPAVTFNAVAKKR